MVREEDGGGFRVAGSNPATLVLVATRTPVAGIARASPADLALAWTAGHPSYPAWILLTFVVGSALGFEPIRTAPGAAPPALWLSAGLLAPLFEELLYRERIFDAPRPRVGAVVATSALFALPHTGPWQQTGTFLVGLGLGALRAAGSPIGACIAAHAGLNAAGLL